MKIVILGGGISGLSAAWFARKKYPKSQITLLEKTGRLGGWIRTSSLGGFLFEQGPRTFQLGRCPHLLALIRDTGLEKELIYSDPSARSRFLWSGGRLRSMGSFLPQLFFALIREPFIAKGAGGDESIYDFARRRLGQGIANTLIDGLALGIYAGDIHKLSIRSCFPFLLQWEQERGSLLLGALFAKKNKGGLFTLKSGMETLALTLASQFDGEVILNAEVEEISQDGAIANGMPHPADLIISALPLSKIGRLTRLWSGFEETDLNVVNLAYGRFLPKKGFGYLVPTEEKERLLGVIWDSSVFPQQGEKMRVTAMLRSGGVDAARDALRRHLGINEEPVFSSVFEAKSSIPQFHVGYSGRLGCFENDVKKTFPLLLLLGNYLQGAAVESCISLAKKMLVV